jgi:hypothetical protein
MIFGGFHRTSELQIRLTGFSPSGSARDKNGGIIDSLKPSKMALSTD